MNPETAPTYAEPVAADLVHIVAAREATIARLTEALREISLEGCSYVKPCAESPDRPEWDVCLSCIARNALAAGGTPR